LIGAFWTAGAIQFDRSLKYVSYSAYLLPVCEAWWLFASFQGLRFVDAGAGISKRGGLSLVFAALTLWPTIGPLSINFPRYVNLDEDKLYAEEAALIEPTVEFDAEAVMYAQRNLVETALRKLQPSRKGTPELFVLALAGDGGENTFLNEAVYAQALLERRFGALNHTQILVNHPRTTSQKCSPGRCGLTERRRTPKQSKTPAVMVFANSRSFAIMSDAFQCSNSKRAFDVAISVADDT